MNKSFLDALLSNQGWGALDPISRAPAYEDDAGNQYGPQGNLIRKGVADGSMTWGETALAGATAPAKLATGLASTLSPYGSEGWQVPPILAEPVRAGNRLLNSGGFPDPQDPQNQQDAVTSLLSFFGANALNPATKLPAGAVGMFAGRKAKTADHAALARAEQMASTGADRNAIWNATGWFQGPDKQWRFEIDDSGAAMAKPLQTVREQFGREAPLDMSFEHAKLFDAYPEARDITYYPTTDYRPGEASFGASVRVPGEDGPAGRIRVGYDETNPFASHMAAPSSTLHELQHYIQRVGEGNFATGGSPKNFAADVKAADEMINTVNQNMRSLSKQMDAARAARDAPLLEELSKRYDDLMGYKLRDLMPRAQIDPVDQYKRLAGEVEARNVQTRMNMSADQRKATPPWETQDVPDADQIIRLLSDTSRPSVMGSAVGAAEQQPARSYHGTRYDVTGKFIPSDDGLLGPGVYSSINPSEAQTFAGHNRGSLNNPIWNYEYGKMFPFDVAQPIATDADWMRVLSNIEGSGTSVDQPRSVAIQAQNALVNEGFGSVRHGDTINTFKPGSITSPLTGEVLFSDTSKPSLLGSAVAAEQAPTKGITAYHGSPHDFDKFDMSKIGTGEGAQAYGHGLYFAEREGVAQSYRKNLSKPFSHAKWLADDGRVLDPYTNPADMAAVRLRSQAEDIDAAIRSFKSEINSSKASDDGTFWRKNYVLERLEQALGHLQKGTQTKLLPFGDGHMYQVRINAEPEDFLDWDKPYSEQPKIVQRLMKYIGTDSGESLRDMPAGDWLSTYKTSAMADDASETLESMLKRRGVPGIKYLDQMSRNAGDGSRNYVVFNQEIIDILKKYGMIPGLYGASQVGQERQ